MNTILKEKIEDYKNHLIIIETPHQSVPTIWVATSKDDFINRVIDNENLDNLDLYPSSDFENDFERAKELCGRDLRKLEVLDIETALKQVLETNPKNFIEGQDDLQKELYVNHIIDHDFCTSYFIQEVANKEYNTTLTQQEIFDIAEDQDISIYPDDCFDEVDFKEIKGALSKYKTKSNVLSF
ncbi:hypothetical protein H5203_21865 [Pseudoalteromonas sp. SG41-1]|uniref:hypothetical protein n=1 Tax=Pseudoalteromonas sp. SG41-1 TaxID=2760979 RepID=UPI0016028944|nr:hypothetical protein [Pseudoalteromonas sp. SG41-1]MBB1508086.1 hypothetical protein [Pseudoalteromonas sp. SG41-1]